MASDATLRPDDRQHAIETACRLHLEAMDLRAAGRPAEAAPLALRSIEILEREDASQLDVANVLLALARIQEDLGHLATAEVSIVRALGILERLRDGNDEDEGDGPIRVRLETQSLGLLANLKRGQGQHPEAEELFRRALALTEQTFGPDDIQMANLLNGLGILHKFQGRYDEAEPLYRRSLALIEKAYGEDHLETASLWHNLGGLEHARGGVENAQRGEPFARRSVEIREKALGSDHPDTAADKAALAALLDAQGKYAEAE
ncbi:MAG TPA: tetratricopeptide repeat protein, partial [Thermoanaerobaculia bacterium]